MTLLIRRSFLAGAAAVVAAPAVARTLTLLGAGPASSGYTFINSEAAAYVAAMAVQPNDARKALIDTWVGALKTAGVWSTLDAAYLLASHNSAAALINAKAPGTFDATLILTPTFTTDRGFTTNGVDNAIQLNFNPSTAGGNFGQNSAMFAIRSLTAGQQAGSHSGWFDGTDGISLFHRDTSDIASFRINQAASSDGVAGAASTGACLQAANRSASNATQLYRNGNAPTVNANPNQTSTALNNNTLYLGRLTAAAFRAIQFASCYIGGSLDATKHAALSAADTAYMQAVGAA